MSEYALTETPAKTSLASQQQGTVGLNLPLHLRPLLIMIDGRRTVSDLLAMGLRNVELNSFDELHQLGLIEAGSGAPKQASPHAIEAVMAAAVAPASAAGLATAPTAVAAHREAPKPARGLSEVRFAVIDVLLDISARDFGANPWVERMENAHTLDALLAEVRACQKSSLAKAHSDLIARLFKAIA